MALDEIAPNWGQALQRPNRGRVAARGAAAPEVLQERRPGVLTRTEKDRVSVIRGFVSMTKSARRVVARGRAVAIRRLRTACDFALRRSGALGGFPP